MAWRRPADKPLSEPMMVIVYWRIYASLGFNELTHTLKVVSNEYVLKHSYQLFLNDITQNVYKIVAFYVSECVHFLRL